MEIDCVFENVPWKVDGVTRYTCVINKKSFEPSPSSSDTKNENFHLKGDHKKRENSSFLTSSTNNNNDVCGLFFTSCELLQVPSTLISAHFKYLKALSIKSSKISEISREDLKSLSNLEVLSLNGNFISYLPTDLFIDFKNLKSFSAANNRIKMIGLEIFDHLKLLNFVDLSGNENYNLCVGNLTNVENFEKVREVLKRKLFATTDEKFEELKQKLAKSESERQILAQKVHELNESNETLIQSQQISVIALEEAQKNLHEHSWCKRWRTRKMIKK